jgi:hypothetical protein
VASAQFPVTHERGRTAPYCRLHKQQERDQEEGVRLLVWAKNSLVGMVTFWAELGDQLPEWEVRCCTLSVSRTDKFVR